MAKKAKRLLTYKKDCWPEGGLPEEIYLYVSRGKAHAGRIVIHDYRIDFTDTCMQPESETELNEWIEIMKKAWEIKEEQDKKGWSNQDG